MLCRGSREKLVCTLNSVRFGTAVCKGKPCGIARIEVEARNIREYSGLGRFVLEVEARSIREYSGVGRLILKVEARNIRENSGFGRRIFVDFESTSAGFSNFARKASPRMLE